MTSLQVALYQSLISYASVLFCFARNLTILNFTANLKPYKMAIKKQYLKSKPVCKVTFEVSAKEANSISVVGDFNEWNAEATPLKKLKKKNLKASFLLKREILTNSNTLWMAHTSMRKNQMRLSGTLMPMLKTVFWKFNTNRKTGSVFLP